MKTLLATSGPHVGRRFSLSESIRVGRAPDNDIVLSDSLVSRYHSRFNRSGSNYIVTDLKSKNGTIVNDKATDECRLQSRDRIRIGATTFVFDDPQQLKTARFTNTLIHFESVKDDTMRVIGRPAYSEAEAGEATALILKLAKVFEAASAELPEVLHKILGHLLELMGATAGSLLLRGRGDGALPLTASPDGEDLHLNLDATRTAMTEGKAVLTASVSTSKKNGQPERRARKAMIVPMYDGEETFGAIHLERPKGGDYSLKDIGFLQALARLVSGAVLQAIRIDQLGQQRSNSHPHILGESASMVAVRTQLNRIAGVDSTILITGETGTGKELMARAIHDQSSRGTGPIVVINCAAIPVSLIESELFGHERGAFTGAEAMKRGKVELADRGTLFLDEIGEMDIEIQPKILRFLEEQLFYRVGGVRPIQTDVRIIAATNRDLDRAVREGRFRQDLRYRLNVLHVEMPPLRKRREDIRTIVNARVHEVAARVGKPFLGIEDKTWVALEHYSWPGNVRELLQSLERALILSDDGVLTHEHFQISELGDPDTTGSTLRLSRNGGGEDGEIETAGASPPTLADVEKKAIVQALSFSRGNKVRASELLGIHRNTLRKKITDYEIDTKF